MLQTLLVYGGRGVARIDSIDGMDRIEPNVDANYADLFPLCLGKFGGFWKGHLNITSVTWMDWRTDGHSAINGMGFTKEGTLQPILTSAENVSFMRKPPPLWLFGATHCSPNFWWGLLYPRVGLTYFPVSCFLGRYLPRSLGSRGWRGIPSLSSNVSAYRSSDDK